MNGIDWSAEHEESIEEVNAALDRVVKEGDRTKQRRRTIAGGATALILVAVLGVTSLQGSNLGGGPSSQIANGPTSTAPQITSFDPVLASVVIAKVNAATAGITTLSGTMTREILPLDGVVASTDTVDFRLNDRGDRWERHHSGNTISENAYIASSGLNSACCENGVLSRHTNSPDLDSVSTSSLNTPLAIIRTLANRQVDPTVGNTTFQGQPAWQLAIRNVHDGGPWDAYRVTVLAGTALPVEVQAFTGGQLGERVTTSYLKVNDPLPPSAFDVAAGPDVRVATTDDGYVRTSPSGTEALVGYPAFIPRYVPGGFELATVSAYKGDPQSVIEGADGQSIPQENQIDLVYRHGLQRIQVQTLASQGLPDSKWRNPEAGVDSPDRPDAPFKVTGGPFNGLTGHTGVGLSGPNIWVVGSRYVLSISGDASIDDMKKIAGSLEG